MLEKRILIGLYLKQRLPKERKDMGLNTVKAKGLRLKHGSWCYGQRKERLAGKCDEDTLLEYIEKIFKDNKITRKKHNGFSNYFFLMRPDHIMTLGDEKVFKAATVGRLKKSIKNGHVDTNIWLNIYPQKYFRKDFGFRYKTTHSSWVIDLDGSPWGSIDEMRGYLSKNGILEPSLIVNTGPNNFHLLYTGPKGYWTKHLRDKVLMDMAGIEEMPTSQIEFKSLLKEKIGVDPSYYALDPIHHKIRLPGSVNTKYNGFVCKGWQNPDYDERSPVEKLGMTAAEKIRKDLKKAARKKKTEEKSAKEIADQVVADEIYNKHYKAVFKLVKEKLGKSPNARKVSEMICENVTFLKNGRLAIDQRTLAKKWGLQQPSVSRILRSLREKGILEITKSHKFVSPKHWLNKSAVYGLGKDLKNLLEPPTRIVSSKKIGDIDKSALMAVLKSSYEKGNTNEAFLNDIRAFYSLGGLKEDFIEVATLKFKEVGSSGRRPKHISSAWDSWERKFANSDMIRDNGFTRPYLPLFDADELIERFK